MTDEKELTPLTVEAIEKETKAFDCPKCGAHLQFRAVIKVTGVQETMTREECAARDKRELQKAVPLPPEQEETLRAFKEDGTFDAFKRTVEVAYPAGGPKKMEKFLFKVLETAVPVTLPGRVAERIINELEALGEKHGYVQAFVAQQIAIVALNQCPRLFLPAKLLKETRRAVVTKSLGAARFKTQTETLEHWIRTKNGYIVGTGEFFKEMQGKSPGDFARAVSNF